jgi:hypothetical protein
MISSSENLYSKVTAFVEQKETLKNNIRNKLDHIIHT